MACCDACAANAAKGNGGSCAGGSCTLSRNVGDGAGKFSPSTFGAARAKFVSPVVKRSGPFAYLAAPSPAKRAAVLARNAGALSDAADAMFARDTVADAREAAAEGRAESIRRGVAAQVYGRTAGDAATPAFDPRDPASMTETRWRSMSAEERTAWVNANVRSEELRTQAIRDAVSGAYGVVNGIVTAERDRRMLEIREAAEVERRRIAADLDAERARLDADVARARVEVERLRAEAAIAAARAGQVPPEDRAAADAAAAAAAERQRQAEAAAMAAEESRRRVEADAEALASQARMRWTVGGLVVLVLSALGVWVWQKVKGGERAPYRLGAGV